MIASLIGKEVRILFCSGKDVETRILSWHCVCDNEINIIETATQGWINFDNVEAIVPLVTLGAKS